MNQHMDDSEEHYQKRRFFTKKGTWINKIVGDTLTGNCYHHQGLSKIGKNLIISAVDDVSNEPHALELDDPDRFVVGVLWHPEATFMNEMSEVHDELNVKLLQGFVDKAAEYKRIKG